MTGRYGPGRFDPFGAHEQVFCKMRADQAELRETVRGMFASTEPEFIVAKPHALPVAKIVKSTSLSRLFRRIF